jgi:asparagine synthase (glutamine-hydrolysing)
MCGIVGIIDYENNIEKELLVKMRDSLEHRGPDDKGYFIDNHIGLGHRRLSIIDTSYSGHQPMSNEDDSIWISYNGEIYNHLEIRNQLQKKGHVFKSNTDTEVIIHAYEEYGEKCLQLFNGMFAFAIWDSNKKQLFLARDRIGQKPLFCYMKNNLFLFSSEIKSLVHHPKFIKEINFDSVSHYLSYQFIPHPYSIYKDCYKLNPGHYLVYKKNQINIQKYWDIDFQEINDSEENIKKNILTMLEESTEKRLMSDVPLGAFLSGGLDSSAIVYFMSKRINNIKTHSIGFQEEKCDETKYAQIISDEFNTNHKVKIIDYDITKEINLISKKVSEPLGDPASIPTYILSEFAKKDVTVSLSGDAGDEIFGGYNRYSANLKRNNLDYKFDWHFDNEKKKDFLPNDFHQKLIQK